LTSSLKPGQGLHAFRKDLVHADPAFFALVVRLLGRSQRHSLPRHDRYSRLTGVYNRRHFERRIKEELKKSRLEGKALSLVILDLDHFKSINDRFGHDKGDQVLKATTNLIQERLQGKGTLARWGGEEFVILLPGLSADDAKDLAETLRKDISNMCLDGAGSITASFGVAGLAPDDTFDTLVKKADNMLYEAKANGRNRVCVAVGERSAARSIGAFHRYTVRTAKSSVAGNRPETPKKST